MAQIDELRKDCSAKQKNGIYFILASIVIWALIIAVEFSGLPIFTKNLLVFCCTAPLMPIAWGISKLIGIDFQNADPSWPS